MVILRSRMRIGPKGQVVIPKKIRDEKKLLPGDEVFVVLDEKGILIEKLPGKDVVKAFEEIAHRIKFNKKIPAHAYEAELEERWELSQKRT